MCTEDVMLLNKTKNMFVFFFSFAIEYVMSVAYDFILTPKFQITLQFSNRMCIKSFLHKRNIFSTLNLPTKCNTANFNITSHHPFEKGMLRLYFI